MEGGEEIEIAEENEFPSVIGRKYSPVVAHDNDSAVIEMSSVRPGSSSSLPNHDLKNVKVGVHPNMASEERDESLSNHSSNGPQRESKLELFGFDSLVNILGLKSMTGDQIPAPSSPRDGEDITLTLEQPKPTADKSGTLMGVFMPCLQNILGIIYYIRFSWIVGMAGIGESLLLVVFCGSCTFLTTISLSAIASNGAMKGGGPYYLIGRALGPEVGVSIGLCFFLGNAIAGAMYVLGAVETFLNAVPSAGIFRETITRVNGTDIAEPITSPSLHDLQIYGIVVSILLCFVVFGGVKMINRVAPAFLVPVLFSLLCIFVGIFSARHDHPAVGITGLSLESFKNNWGSAYQMTNNAGIPDPNGDIYWNFNALVGLFFPAVTGIMAGSNRSASLKDTQRAIPVGTLAATLTTTSLYLVSVLLFGAVATRDKLLTDRLLSATVAWPFPAIVYVGIILSTLGAALQSLTGAPRLLAAIANDEILPVLNYFKVADGHEPHVATLFTAIICIGCVVIGNLDLVSPTTTMFYLVCYAGVNLSCFLLDLLDAPSWRPRWKFHHWSLSLVGALLCIGIFLAAAESGGGIRRRNCVCTKDDFLPEESFKSWGNYTNALRQTPTRLIERALTRSNDEAELEAKSRSHHEMKKTLTWWDLIWFGMGAVIGAGIFVLTGLEASQDAGPAVVLSYAVSGVSALLSVFCYTEFAVEIPVAGGSFAYLRVELGDFVAFIAAGNILLEYVIGGAAVARSWTSYFATLLNFKPEKFLITAHGLAKGYNQLDPIAVAVCFIICIIAIRSTKGSSRLNYVASIIHIVVIVFIIICGLIKADTKNYTPFTPFGVRGIFKASAVLFFAYVGFDAVSTMAEETKDPARDIPIGLVGSMVITTTVYCLLAITLCLMQPYQSIDPNAPFSVAFKAVGWSWAQYIVAAGALKGMTSVLLVGAVGQARYLTHIARTHMMPPWFSYVDEKTGTPVNATAVMMSATAIIAFFTKLEILSNLLSISTLFIFMLVALALLVRRYYVSGVTTNANRNKLIICILLILGSSIATAAYWGLSEKGWIGYCFTVPIWVSATAGICIFIPQARNPKLWGVPLVPWLPSLSIAINIFLLGSIDKDSFIRFAGWTGFLLAYYFFFGLHASYDTAKEFEKSKGWKNNIEEGKGTSNVVVSKDVPIAPGN